MDWFRYFPLVIIAFDEETHDMPQMPQEETFWTSKILITFRKIMLHGERIHVINHDDVENVP